MTVIDSGPGFQIERADSGTTLVVTDSWTSEAERVVVSGRVDGLDLNYAKGFKNTDLAFFRDWPLKRVTVLARTVKDLSPIYRLSSTLEALSVDTGWASTLDLAELPALKTLSAGWEQVAKSISEAPLLQDLFIRGYSELNLDPFRWNSRLRRLRLKDRPQIQSLHGISSLPGLEHLGVYLAPLSDITAICELDPTQLRELHIESCRVGSLEPVACATGLELLNASDCGDIASVEPIRLLQDLKVLWLFGTTRIVDGDLTPIAALPRLDELRMRPRKAYRPSVDDIQIQLAQRASLSESERGHGR